ncbi:hypothetical protein K2X14_00490 [Acetobacter sp. TBRC 12305]|uniref:Secreted protein n=1 Tax=Acetobacter garciniae TaxID=2817435 RepID=A0A939HKC6_9PROT|nr:hypothetical protein [Acetobacter garciniae]MBO1323631.1 hypothetical protein [Acetobacter garciniae]MBX0343320.1 hypothetical protein [Acetobacter garciniae]
MPSARIFLIAGLFSVAGGSCLLATQGPHPVAPPHKTGTTQVLGMIAHDGATRTAQTLSRRRQWKEIVLGLSTGQRDAERALSLLLPKADAPTAALLRLSMKAALPYQAQTVLSTLRDSASSLGDTRAICSTRGMDTAWRISARKAVASVHDWGLRMRVKTCLNSLAES